MQMVVVIGVVAGRQHDVEAFAGMLGERMQELTLGARAGPVAPDIDDRAVGQVEADQIECAAMRVLAQPLAVAANVAAGIGAGVIGARDALMQIAPGQRLDPLILEIGEGDRELAAQRGRPVEIDAVGGDLDPVAKPQPCAVEKAGTSWKSMPRSSRSPRQRW